MFHLLTVSTKGPTLNDHLKSICVIEKAHTISLYWIIDKLELKKTLKNIVSFYYVYR